MSRTVGRRHLGRNELRSARIVVQLVPRNSVSSSGSRLRNPIRGQRVSHSRVLQLCFATLDSNHRGRHSFPTPKEGTSASYYRSSRHRVPSSRLRRNRLGGRHHRHAVSDHGRCLGGRFPYYRLWVTLHCERASRRTRMHLRQDRTRRAELGPDERIPRGNTYLLCSHRGRFSRIYATAIMSRYSNRGERIMVCFERDNPVRTRGQSRLGVIRHLTRFKL